MVTKQTLRKIYLGKRKILPSNVVANRSNSIFEFFITTSIFTSCEHVHVFMPIAKQNEVITGSLISWLFKNKKKVYTSVSDLQENEMRHYQIDASTQFEINSWGIPEPKGGQELKRPNLLELILVPLVIADKNGNRLGYGKGYYDHFLNQCDAKALKVGLSLAPLLDNIVQTEPHDVKLDYCISHLGVQKFYHEKT